MMRTLLFALCISVTLPGQDSATFRTETRLVEVDVVVHRDGKSVDGLKADDFSLFDKGKKQRIAIFSVRRNADVQAPRPLPAGVVTNRVVDLSAGGETPTPTVILLDTLNSKPEHMAEIRRQLLLYLDRAPKNESFALYSLNKTLNRLHDFTGDRNRLRDLVNRWLASASVDLMTDDLVAEVIASLPSGDALLAGMAQAAIKEMADAADLNRASVTGFALEMIAKHLSGLPGRKKLIWVGGGFPAVTSDIRGRVGGKQIETRYYTAFIDKATRAMNQAQVAVYPIDSRPPCSPTCMADPFFLRSGLDTMNRVASATGGRAIYIVNDVAGAIEESVQDSEITYRLGFYPEKSALDGKDHNIKVEVARPGVDVRYRRAYLAAENKPPKQADRLASLRESIASPLDSTQIGLTAQVLPSSMTSDRKEALLAIDTRTLQLAREETAKGESVSAALITVATYFQNQSKVPANITDLKLTFTDTRLPEVLREGYLIRLEVDGRGVPGKWRVAVQDRSTGQTGSVTLDVR